MTTDGFSGLQKNVILNKWYRIELDEKVEAKRGFFFLGLWGMDEVLSFVAKLTLARNNGAEVRHRCEMHSRLRMVVVCLTSMMILPALSPSMVMSKKTRGFPMIGGPRGAEYCGWKEARRHRCRAGRSRSFLFGSLFIRLDHGVTSVRVESQSRPGVLD